MHNIKRIFLTHNLSIGYPRRVHGSELLSYDEACKQIYIAPTAGCYSTKPPPSWSGCGS